MNTVTPIKSLTEQQRQKLIINVSENIAKLPRKSTEFINQLRVLNMLTKSLPARESIEFIME